MITNKEKLVLRINELHHDLESERYHDSNNKMFQSEQLHWKRFFEELSFKNITILEIGTGTGFLPNMLIDSYTNKNQITYICTDISENILRTAKRNINNRKSKKNIDFRFVKLSSDRLPFKKNSIDVIIMNSVLHHLPNTDVFFNDAKKILKKEGILVIGHEPNALFHKNKLSLIITRTFSKIAPVIGKLKISKKEFEFNNKINLKINNKLKKEGLIDRDLTQNEISGLVDFGATKGFDMFKISKKYRFTILKFYSYNALENYSFNYKNILFEIYEKIMGWILPKWGATFFVIMKNRP